MCETKTCSKCGEVKGLGEFGKHAARKDGLDTRCKQCNREAATAYRNANIEQVRQKDRARVAAMTPEKKREKWNRWADANREHVRAYSREMARRLYQRNPEKFKAASRKWYAENTEQALERQAEWRAQNRHRLAEYAREYRAANAEKVAAFVKAYRSRHDVKATARARKQREVADLCDGYVKRVIFPDGIPPHIPPELIALKREQLAIRRMARELKNAANQSTTPTGENE